MAVAYPRRSTWVSSSPSRGIETMVRGVKRGNRPRVAARNCRQASLRSCRAAASRTLPVAAACAGHRAPTNSPQLPCRRPRTSSSTRISVPASISRLTVSPVVQASRSSSGRAIDWKSMERCASAPSSMARGPSR